MLPSPEYLNCNTFVTTGNFRHVAFLFFLVLLDGKKHFSQNAILFYNVITLM